MPSSAFVIAVFEFVLLIFSLSFHECAHAWMASRLGDQTARLQGRVTLNPMVHVDPVGTLLIPALAIFGPFVGFTFFSGFLIGWAKPTPVITRNFRKIVRDDNLVTLAGPVSNLLLVGVAFVSLAVICVAVPGGRSLMRANLAGALAFGSGLQPLVLLALLAIEVNLSLFFFNLLPITPLDGGRLLLNSLPYRAQHVYERVLYWVGFAALILASLSAVIWLFLRTLGPWFGDVTYVIALAVWVVSIYFLHRQALHLAEVFGGYLFMIVVGGFILRLLVGPSIGLIFSVLTGI